MDKFRLQLLDAIKKTATDAAPTPDDFASFEGFTLWQDTYGNMSFARTLYDIIRTYYSTRASKERQSLREKRGKSGSASSSSETEIHAAESVVPRASATHMQIHLEIKGATNVGGDGKPRNLLCRVQMGNILKETEVIEKTTNPTWDGHVNL